MPTISEQKKIFRKQMAQTVREYCAKEDFVSASAAARRAVMDSGLVAKADIVLGYLFHGNEADCTALLYHALNEGKTVALPRVVPHTDDMDFYQIDPMLPFGDQIEKGSFGISEPVPTLETLLLDDSLAGKSLLVIVPGLAFSADGKRLGHGKGFYDRYIVRLKATGARIILAGFCFPCQLVPDLPTDEHDVRMDYVFCGGAVVKTSG